ncbi:MAG: hypothetical protein AB8V23_04665 [Candidatus Midichloria sp.]
MDFNNNPDGGLGGGSSTGYGFSAYEKGDSNGESDISLINYR